MREIEILVFILFFHFLSASMSLLDVVGKIAAGLGSNAGTIGKVVGGSGMLPDIVGKISNLAVGGATSALGNVVSNASTLLSGGSSSNYGGFGGDMSVGMKRPISSVYAS